MNRRTLLSLPLAAAASHAADYKPKRINKAIELLADGQQHFDENGYLEGRKPFPTGT